MLTEDELDRRLALAAPPMQIVDSDVLDSLASTTRASGQRSRRRRLLGGLLAGLLVATGGIVAAPAAADGIRHLLARTDKSCQGGTECTPGDPVIDLSASDLPELVHADYPAYLVLPPGMSRSDIESVVAQRLAQPDAAAYEVLIAQQFENVATCGWILDWLAADSTNDENETAAAAAAIRLSVSWPAHLETFDRWQEIQGAFAYAAEHGDRTGVRAASVINVCGATPDAQVNEWLERFA